MVSQLWSSGNTRSWQQHSLASSEKMDRSATPRWVSGRNSSAPVKCRSGERASDGAMTCRIRRVSRLDTALEVARENVGYSPFCTPRLAGQQLPLGKVASNSAAADQLQSVYDRVEQRNNTLTQSPARIPTLTMEQLPLAEQAVQTFVEKMRRVADNADEQTKSNLTRSLTSDLEMLDGNFDTRSTPVSSSRHQNHERDVLNQLDDIACWYSMGKEVGRGTFGCVRLATHRLSGTPVAIKSYARLHGARSCLPVDAIGKRVIGDSGGDALEWRRVRQEVSVLSKLRAHPNIMRFVEVFETPTRIHAVTELVRGTNMCDVLRRAPGQHLTETRAKRIFRQLATAVEALHAQGVIHRDLKLENVLLDESSGHATIIDFGFSDFEETDEPQTFDPAENNPMKKQSKKKNFCGTPSYMAPEVVASDRYDGRPVDVWSLGVLLYVMVCGKFPFQGASFHQLYQKLRSGAQRLVLPPTLSFEARALLQSVLVVDPAKRPSASELCHCSWLQKSRSPQVSPLQVENTLSLSFEAWAGKQQVICAAISELYGVQVDPSDLTQAKSGARRHGRVSAFLDIAAALSNRCFLEYVEASQASLPLDIDDTQPQQSAKADTASSNSVQEAAELSSKRHKQQLEKLIGLVKTSLATK